MTANAAADSRHRIIMHVDMDAFFVTVEEVLNPRLKGKAVIVGGDPGGRGVVSSASYKAREAGVRSAMPLKTAKRLCPRAIFLQGSLGVYADFSRRIMEIMGRFTPSVEVVSVDEAYLDMTGCQRLHKAGPLAVAQRIRDAIQNEVGVPCSIGIASNKITAKIASTSAKPGGMLYIMPGYEAEFMAPLPINRLPGVGPSTEAEFIKLGVTTIGGLAGIPEAALKRVFGSRGAGLACIARGDDHREVDTDDEEAKSIGKEVTYSVDTNDMETMEATLSYLSERVGARLRRTGLAFRRVTLKLRYADFNTITRSRVIEAPSTGSGDIFKTVKKLLVAALPSRRMGVRLVGVTVSSFAEPERQVCLFGNGAKLAVERLDRSVDMARDRFGFDAAMTARSRIYAAMMDKHSPSNGKPRSGGGEAAA
ncbi:MAG: DNA polymerase IV [Nitrospinae bacterium]|nr:DNA polymerase IV [Nitrospinota bacterium]